MKKFLCSLLVVVMCIASVPLGGFVGLDLSGFDFGTNKVSAKTVESSGSCGSNVTYTYNSSTGELTIKGSGKMNDYNSSPFYDSDIKSVVIESGVTSIGNSTFSGCTNLTSITIPDSVTSIGYHAFDYCTSLTSITVDSNNTKYSSDSYGVLFNKDKTELIQYPVGNKRTSYSIPDSVTSIGKYAFYWCTGLTSVTIPDSVTSIGNYAFYNCTGLTSITIPDSVTGIGYSAFDGCYKLSAVYISDIAAWCNMSFSGSTSNPLYYAKSLYLNNKLVMRLTIPDTVTEIKDYTFYNCNTLLSITIPDSVTSIGSSAFSGCSNLTSVTIPDSVTSIGGFAFDGCTGLTSVTIPDSVTSIGNSAFCGCTSLTSVTIPDSVTSIGGGAFSDCTSLTSVTIGNSVTSIGGYAFKGCTGLTSVTIPNSVTSIGNYAFNGCTGLTSVTIPDSVTSIGDDAFSDCTGLTSVTIPDSVTSIGNYAFNGCTGLTSVTIGNGVTSIGNSAFYGCDKLSAVYISDIAAWCNISFSYNSYSLYPYSSNPLCYAKSLYLNSELVTDLVIPDGVTSIKEYAFYNCKSLTSVTIPESVTRIDTGAFADVSKNMTVYGYTDSYAEFFATTNGYKFIAICTHETSSYTYSDEIAATCTADGYTAGTYCNECKRWIEGHEVIKAAHTDENEDSVCDVCGDTLEPTIKAGETKKIDVSAGEIVYLSFKPTSTGTYTFTSNSSSDTYGYLFDADKNQIASDDDGGNGNNFKITRRLIAGTKYYFGAKYYSSSSSGSFNVTLTCDNDECTHANTTSYDATAATCTTDGYTAGTYCNDCKTWISGHEVLPAGHDWVLDLTKSAPSTCTEKGLNFYNCSRCEETNSEEIALISHAWGSWIIDVEATCQTSGTKHRECASCALVETEDIPNGGGCTLVSSDYVAPTCTTPGYTGGTHCSKCNTVYISPTEIPALGHDYWLYRTTPATTTENGTKVSTCQNCGDVKTETIQAIATVSLSSTKVYYNGKVQKPSVIVKDTNGNNLVKGTDFNYYYSSHAMINPGVYKVTVSFKGNYSGKVELDFTIFKCDHIDENNDHICDICHEETLMYAGNYDNFIFKLYTDGTLVISGTGNVYCRWRNYRDFIKKVIVEEGITSIQSGSFAVCNNLTEVSLPSTLTQIGDEAFYSCSSLKAIDIPKNVNRLGFSVFSGCISLEALEIPEGITELGYYFASGCTALTNVKLPSTLLSLGDGAFAQCTSLETIDLPSDLLYIYGAFSHCTALKNVTLPDGLEKISYGAFESCTSLNSINIPNSVTEIGNRAFYNCTNLKQLTTLSNVKSIGSYAFYRCHNLTNVVMQNVEEINENAFSNCIRLKEINIPASIMSIKKDAFNDCIRLEKIRVNNANCQIDSYSTTFPTNATLYGYSGSTLEKYADDWLRTFKSFDVNGHVHEYTSRVTTAATCTTDGKITYTCACGDSYTETISAHHTDENQDNICDSCGTKLKDTTGEHEHTYTSTTVPATCTTDGKITYTCACGDSYTETIYAHHTDENGDDICDVCRASLEPSIKLGETKTIDISAGETVYLAFTPEKSGTYKFTSNSTYDSFGYLFDADLEKITSNDDGPDGKNFEIICDLEAGVKYYFGARFYATSRAGSMDVTLTCVHKWDEGKVTTKATHTQEGVKTFTCVACGNTYTESIAKLPEHTYTLSKTVAPTCTVAGSKTFTCTCGDSYSEAIPVISHIDSNSDSYCDSCGNDLDPEAHCSCSCHKSGFDKVLFVIVNFFQKLFGQNTVCDCGAKH